MKPIYKEIAGFTAITTSLLIIIPISNHRDDAQAVETAIACVQDDVNNNPRRATYATLDMVRNIGLEETKRNLQRLQEVSGNVIGRKVLVKIACDHERPR